ncbi:BnaC05g15070D [Brassica napus]|uniref:(rape) hypothetical protein n=1 Tax=Brassica napus TaxID=3708 RepID=A0A078HLP4_BRANA|nr:unnamed protein product [Brassica napus]CDY39380.1 BnaC05g15070D [Brassica napus]
MMQLIIVIAPPFHHLLFQGREIFEPISPDPPSLNNPRYDTSTHRATPKPPLHPITPETSPTKSSGFAEHASSVNAFVSTATSKRTSLPILNVELSHVLDSSPAKPTPRHQPSDEECHLAEELFKCPFIPTLALITPQPQQQWDLFHSTLTANKQVFHITPSQFDFSNKFLLEIAQRQKWVTTFVSPLRTYIHFSASLDDYSVLSC